MVLGYFGKTPVAPDPEIVKIASEKLGLEPTTELAIDLADKDETKSLAHWTKKLEAEGIEIARRTVAKYREQLGLPPSSQRRRAAKARLTQKRR